jgi:hypothetical protein
VIVVEAHFGDRLAALADSSPIWIADTPGNADAVRDFRSAHATRAALTTFRVDPAVTPAAWFLDILPDVDLHHGTDSQRPAWQHLRCYGTAPTDDITTALREYEVRECVALPDGFRASRDAPPVG